MKGSRMLQVVGILMIIGGGLVILMCILAIAGSAALGSIAGAAGAAALGGAVLVGTIGTLLAGVIELVAGIMGVKNWRTPSKAQSCLIMGIVIIALQVLSLILNLVGGGSVDWFNLLLGLVLPVLYIVGAMQLKKLA